MRLFCGSPETYVALVCVFSKRARLQDILALFADADVRESAPVGTAFNVCQVRKVEKSLLTYTLSHAGNRRHRVASQCASCAAMRRTPMASCNCEKSAPAPETTHSRADSLHFVTGDEGHACINLPNNMQQDELYQLDCRDLSDSSFAQPFHYLSISCLCSISLLLKQSRRLRT